MHNRLYRNVSLDERTMDLYPDDGYLPGIEESVIHDDRADVEDTFKEETAGMSEHPAELFAASSKSFDDEISGSSATMIEKTGVTDPECDKVPGRLFTAATLKNLVSDDLSCLTSCYIVALLQFLSATTRIWSLGCIRHYSPQVQAASTSPIAPARFRLPTRQNTTSTWPTDHSGIIIRFYL